MHSVDHLILSSSDRSVRVRRVLSAALRCVLAKRAAIFISKTESQLLARSYTPRSILGAYVRQREVKRTGLTPKAGLAIATWIIASDGVRNRASDLPNEDRTELNRLVAAAFNEIQQRSQQLSTAKTYNSQKDREILKLGREVEKFGPQFRTFIRRADRLWSKQVSTLRVFIDDVNACDAAVAKLAMLYQKAFEASSLLGARQ